MSRLHKIGLLISILLLLEIGGPAQTGAATPAQQGCEPRWRLAMVNTPVGHEPGAHHQE